MPNSKISTLLGIVMILTACTGAQRDKLESRFHRAAQEVAGSSPQHAHNDHKPGAEIPTLPAGIPSQIKEYEGFTVSFNPTRGIPNWSAWELLSEETEGNESRKNQSFWQDSDLAGCPISKDYSNSGYDRGHLCPAADMKWSAQSMTDCFSMANITPQHPDLNRGAWQTLEKKCRLWAQRDGTLLIVAGPIFEPGNNNTIAGGKIAVPDAFFKVIAAPYIDHPRAIAFVYPNMTAPGDMARYAMSVDELEEMTGIDFFPQLPDSLENQIEKNFSFTEWNKR